MELPVKLTLKTSRFALLAGLRPPFRESDRYKELQKNHLVRSTEKKRQKYIFSFIVNSQFPQFFGNRISGSPSKKNIEKIHFLILPKQNTFTKPRKLKNCVNTAITKTKSIIILDFSQTNII